MAKQKKIKSQKPAKENICFNPKYPGYLKVIITFVIILLPLCISVYYIVNALNLNNEHGFPLDDPWIHLTFAKNLIEYGSFSYFKNHVVTAGSTSPVYTLLLAPFFLIIKNEFILSYSLGIIFFCLAVYFYYRLSQKLFDLENWLPVFAALTFCSDRWINFISVSGMETSMFIFVLVVTYYFYLKRKAVPFAVMSGLILWSRPDGIVFLIALIIDYLFFSYTRKFDKEKTIGSTAFSRKELITIAVIFGVLTILYFAMNLFLSGSLLPNTYAAKINYYKPEFRSRSDFLKFEVWQYFTEGSYVLLIAPFIIGCLMIFRDAYKRKYNKLILPMLFIFGLIFIYWYKLPYAHRFGRYLMPVIPFYILIFVYGTRAVFQYLYSLISLKKLVNVTNITFLFIVLIFSVSESAEHKNLYAGQTKHIGIRQVTTARWLKDNTPENSVIAVHDVGAIGFYSGRKIIDVAGLINPEYILKLNEKNFSQLMIEDFKNNGVTHIAFLREWYQVTNQQPLFTTGDKNFELMEVYRFEPERTHILSREVNGMNNYALQMIQSKQIQQALSVLNRAYQIDPNSSLTTYYLAYALIVNGDKPNAEKFLKKALELNPDYREATLSLSDFYLREGKKQDAKLVAESFLKRNPSDTLVKSFMNKLGDTANTN